MSNWDDDPEIRSWLDRARRELGPKISESAVGISIMPADGQPDPKLAVELGYMIMLDKPIILAVEPGQKVPDKLALCADEIVEISRPLTPANAQALYEAIDRVNAKLGDTDGS